MTTNKGTVITAYIVGLLEQNQTDLNFDEVRKGDTRVINVGRLICVEPTRKLKRPVSTGHRFDSEFETSIIIYETGADGVEEVQNNCDELTEAIEALLDKDASPTSLGLGGTQLGGLISKGWCSSSEHGYRVPSSQLTRANRLVFYSLSRTGLLG